MIETCDWIPSAKMDHKACNKASEIIEIEDDIIVLDDSEKTPEELMIDEWDAGVRKKLALFTISDNEKILADLMTEYLTSLREIANKFEDSEALRTKVYRHITFFYSYYVELHCCNADNYLSVMEDILALYCNLEIEVMQFVRRKVGRKVVAVCKRIINMLTVYLLDKTDHILHVLMKNNANNSSEHCIAVLRMLYKHFLTKVPVRNFSEESFCRNYILFQKWKQIRPVADWPDMDRVMYKRFKRKPEWLEENETLKKILMPKCSTTVDVVLRLFLNIKDMSDAYFKHMETKNADLDLDLDLNTDLILGDPVAPSEDENEDDAKFLKTFRELELVMSNKESSSSASNNRVICKQEVDEDDDVVFMGVSILQMPQPRSEKLLNEPLTESEDDKNEEQADQEKDNPSAIVPPPLPSPCSTTETDKSEEVSTTARKTVEEVSTTARKTVEVEIQVDASENQLYAQYGIYTPPSESLDNNPKVSETCVYTDMNNSANTVANTVTMKSVEVQVDAPTYNVVLTPPSEDLNIQQPDRCYYTNISHQQVCISGDEAYKITETDASEVSNDEYNMIEEEIEVEDLPVATPITAKDAYESFGSNNQIDTGQESDTAKDYLLLCNGNTVIKPLLTTNDNANPAKIVFTSLQKIKTANLDDFSRFEDNIHNQLSDNNEIDDLLSGPVTACVIEPSSKINIIAQEKLTPPLSSDCVDNNKSPTRVNSPAEMTSPSYEKMSDFRRYYSDRVNGRTTPLNEPPNNKINTIESLPLHVDNSYNYNQHNQLEVASSSYGNDTVVRPGILRKSNKEAREKKNFRITFSNINDDPPRRCAVRVPKRVREDVKLNMVSKVVLERISFIERTMMQNSNKSTTRRVDYDKSANNNDVVRCISPQHRYTWILKSSTNASRSAHLTGKVKFVEYLKVKKYRTKCEQDESCCNELARQFDQLNCKVPEENVVLNLKIPDPVIPIPESEFSNSPQFLQENLVKKCLEEAALQDEAIKSEAKPHFLSDNSNFYTPPNDIKSSNFDSSSSNNNNSSSSNICDLIKLPTAVPQTYDFDKTFKNEIFSKIDLEKEDSEDEIKLPLKKRKLSAVEAAKKEEISYPATPMISIAEVEALHLRKFKTAAERKEMPPPTVRYNNALESDPSPIVTDQFNINNHTYNNPTINYHMNNVPVPFVPCGSYYLPQILLPFNNVSNFEPNKINAQQSHEKYAKKERKTARQRRRH